MSTRHATEKCSRSLYSPHFTMLPIVALSVLVALVVGFVHRWAIKRKRQLGIFRRLGIPGPNAKFLSGNVPEVNEDQIKIVGQWIQEYGKVFGVFIGDQPYVLLTDPEVIKECLVKEFAVFRYRSRLPLEPEPIKSSLLCLKGDECKHVRGVFNGSFSVAKIKLMTPTLYRCARVTLEILDEAADTGKLADITRIAQGYSMDVITKCALAWEVDCQQNQQNSLLQDLEQIFFDLQGWVVVLAATFPPSRTIMEWCFRYCRSGRVFRRIVDDLREVVRLRREGKRPAAVDLLQLMLDAQKSSSQGGEKGGPTITDAHIVGNSFLALAAGYETTAKALAFILYELARHPEEQERIYVEMNALFGDRSSNCSQGWYNRDSGDLEYGQLHSLRRLDAVVCECLRLYPPILSFVTRTCSRDVTVGRWHIPAGVNIMVHVWHVHHDQEFWADPYSFDPDRFYIEPTSGGGDDNGTFSCRNSHPHHAAAYLPFGLGPRECIGRQFALLELKVVVSKIVQRYRLALPHHEGDKHQLKIKARVLITHPETNIKLLLERRNAK